MASLAELAKTVCRHVVDGDEAKADAYARLFNRRVATGAEDAPDCGRHEVLLAILVRRGNVIMRKTNGDREYSSTHRVNERRAV